MNTFVFNPAKEGLRQRVGYFGADNGIYVQLQDSTVSFVRCSSTSGSIVETVVNQSSWNVDKLDGTGPSGITLDISKAQIFWIDMEWLGVGNVRMGFIYNGQFVHCHTFQHANIVATTYLTTACLPLRYEITNVTGTASNSVLKQVCSTILSEGGYTLSGRSGVINTSITSPISMATAGTFYPVLSIRLLSTRLDAIVIPTRISFLGASNTVDYNWRLVVGGTTTGGTWTAAAGGSPVEFNNTPTGFSGGRVIKSGFISGSTQGNSPVNLSNNDIFKYQLERNSFTSTATELSLVAAASSNSSEILGVINWDEVNH